MLRITKLLSALLIAETALFINISAGLHRNSSRVPERSKRHSYQAYTLYTKDPSDPYNRLDPITVAADKIQSAEISSYKNRFSLQPVNKYTAGFAKTLRYDLDPFSVSPYVHLYRFKKDYSVYNDDGKKIATVKKGGIYTGTPDPENDGSIIIDHEYSTLSVDVNNVEKNENAKVLPTAAIGQMGGDIYGVTACGPTAMTILVDWEKQTDTTKDELIKYSQKHSLEDQGAIDKPNGGMTAPKLIELADGYYKGDINAANVYNDHPLDTIDEKIDGGHRSLVAVRYSLGEIVSDLDYAGVHFVIICGYEDTDDGRVYYYADPYYGSGGRSLLKISAKALEKSMKQVNSEPKTLIVLE